MNYYDKLLLESNVELYNDRYNMAIGILESFGIEFPEEAILESYGLDFLLEAFGKKSNSSDAMSDSDAKKTKAAVGKMKSKKDAKGLVATCKKLIQKAKTSKVAMGCLIVALSALCAVLTVVGYKHIEAAHAEREAEKALNALTAQQANTVSMISGEEIQAMTQQVNDLANDPSVQEFISQSQQQQLEQATQTLSSFITG